ncbi:MAG: nuclear transport factor 2 family protein [Proteobacteria bacterium]|nr:nuclear transport factor 2 family protein [Pseudomonadota bacterium]
MQRFIESLIAIAVFATSAPASAASASDVTAIRHARLQQNVAIARHDLDGIASFWTDDVTICRGLGVQVAGKSNYRKLWEDDDPKAPDVIIYERVPTDIEASRDWPLAFETGVWNGRVGGAHGTVVIRGRYTAQWVKRGDRWLIRSEVFVALAGSGPGLKMQSAP